MSHPLMYFVRIRRGDQDLYVDDKRLSYLALHNDGLIFINIFIAGEQSICFLKTLVVSSQCDKKLEGMKTSVKRQKIQLTLRFGSCNLPNQNKQRGENIVL